MIAIVCVVAYVILAVAGTRVGYRWVARIPNDGIRGHGIYCTGNPRGLYYYSYRPCDCRMRQVRSLGPHVIGWLWPLSFLVAVGCWLGPRYMRVARPRIPDRVKIRELSKELNIEVGDDDA